MESEIPENTVEFSSTSSNKKKSNKKRERNINSSSGGKKKPKKQKKQKNDSSSSSTSKKKKSPVKWSADSITTFLTIVREAVVAGKVCTDSGYKTKDWTEFTKAFHKQTGLLEYDQQQLQSKLSYLKTKFTRYCYYLTRFTTFTTIVY